MKNPVYQKLWPVIAAVVLFLILTVAYFHPLFEGKRLFQSDISQFKGMSKEIVDYRASTGKEALWTNSMFGGMPAYQISTVHKGNLMTYVDNGSPIGSSPAGRICISVLYRIFYPHDSHGYESMAKHSGRNCIRLFLLFLYCYPSGSQQ